MTLKEIRVIISESIEVDHFKNIEISIPIINSDSPKTSKGMASFFEFLLEQKKGYAGIPESLPSEIQESKNQIEILIKKVEEFVQTKLKANNSPIHYWDREARNLNRQPWFLIEMLETRFLINLFNANAKYYDGALAFVLDNIDQNRIRQRDYFIGSILAYEFHIKDDESKITKRFDLEKATLTRLRNHYDDIISETQLELVSHLKSSKEVFDLHSDEITKLKEEKEQVFSEWYTSVQNDLKTFNKEALDQIKDLEVLYREKLKLEAPAQYWNLRATKLRKEGYLWLGGLILSILGGVGIFIYALQLLADGTMKEIFDDTATAIKYSITFITLVSFLAFLIKTLSKMTFSTFHLVRDAEEREQLTFVFLAMQKEKAIDPTERHLIMQSLFSRADTGLLKDDGSPTMPGNIFDKIVASGK
ncbi:hypothetical protein P872_14205 [Rhodonellum psychrophilum GCM71 = DSM 17998]|uniref:DUF6161 domain-containing protein n=2 Tax=Rhodonellum TaxID=336827 RepID=U5BIF5_9BACT|nr:MULTISPECIES: DUF6161 domain-containing protein [Rhodonellum]ERM80195.1 hypothetical protein P872_14205 [Rhodonellum psychrophilum GCM71 = DSM 17998]SDZ59225.1 hypothetical protein SAMN05444412_1412 [Rhodonellum ikkaensis]